MYAYEQWRCERPIETHSVSITGGRDFDGRAAWRILIGQKSGDFEPSVTSVSD